MSATSNRTYYHKYKITHYQYLILLNKEFRRFGYRKIILNPLWQHCKVMMYAYVFVYIVLPLIIIIIDFFLSEKLFPYFFHVHWRPLIWKHRPNLVYWIFLICVSVMSPMSSLSAFNRLSQPKLICQ
jgi:hypothetical protein